MFTEKQKQALTVGLIFAVLLGVVVGYYYFMVASKAVASSKKKQATLTAEIDKNQKELDNINDFLADTAEQERLRVKVESAKRRLPNDPEAIEFLSILQDSLKKTGVSFTRVAPLSPINRYMYRELPYEIKGAARYHEFGQFLNLIECHPDRFMRVTRFTIQKNDKRPSIHPIEVGISTFMFKGN